MFQKQRGGSMSKITVQTPWSVTYTCHISDEKAKTTTRNGKTHSCYLSNVPILTIKCGESGGSECMMHDVIRQKTRNGKAHAYYLSSVPIFTVKCGILRERLKVDDNVPVHPKNVRFAF